jgi:uncharacterized protein (DUF2235 family)
MLWPCQWLAENAGDRDRVFLFGFSNGAFAAQTIAQLLECAGLPLMNHDAPSLACILRMYADWRRASMNTKCNSQATGLPDQSFCTLDRCRRNLLGRTRRVTFMGLFDEVDMRHGLKGRIGIGMRRKASARLPSELSHPADIIRHAISIDERQPARDPVFVEEPRIRSQDVKQVWFAGKHAVGFQLRGLDLKC